MKAFLSYSHKDRFIAGRIKQIIENYGVDAFLAHEDINPSDVFIRTIIAKLKTCDLFIPIIAENFNKSNWTDQEAGIAFILKKAILPIKCSKNPHGFISVYQALKMDVAKLKSISFSCNDFHKVAKAINNNIMVGNKFRDAIITKFGKSKNFDSAGKNAKILTSIKGYTIIQEKNIIKFTLKNDQIYRSFAAKKELRLFKIKHKDSIRSFLLTSFNKIIRT